MYSLHGSSRRGYGLKMLYIQQKCTGHDKESSNVSIAISLAMWQNSAIKRNPPVLCVLEIIIKTSVILQNNSAATVAQLLIMQQTKIVQNSKLCWE